MDIAAIHDFGKILNIVQNWHRKDTPSVPIIILNYFKALHPLIINLF